MTQPNSSVADEGGVDAAATSWVINLSASTTPMALTRPTAPELARFTFFVSRRREEGRERFRLHMGYFAAREEAEQMLEIVREVYPAAWVGEAPGRRLPAGGTAPSARATAPEAAPSPSAATPPAAQPDAPGPVIAAKAPAPAAAHVPPPASPTPTAAQRTTAGAQPPDAPAARAQPTPPPRAIAAAATSVAKPADAERPLIAPVASLTPNADLTDSQVLRVLERRVDRSTEGAASGAPPEAAAGAIALLSPQDTQSWHDIRRQLEQDAAVHFAVQLEWSVSPIELARVPELAIFNAYTLYRIEGSRQGRTWYGLRLGFFKDALSAKQVAYYVRSEFAAVAVVPVSPRERGQAKDFGAIELPKTDPKHRRATRDEEITLIDDRPARPGVPSPSGAAARPVATGPGPATAAAPPVSVDDGSADARPAAPSGPRRAGRPRGGPPKSLEETLEILGASQLTIESARRETLLDANVRAQPDRRTTVFSKLLDRLSEKLKK